MDIGVESRAEDKLEHARRSKVFQFEHKFLCDINLSTLTLDSFLFAPSQSLFRARTMAAGKMIFNFVPFSRHFSRFR